MDHPVQEEEVDFMYRRRDQDQEGKPRPVCSPWQPVRPTVGIGPEHDEFDHGPERDGDEDRADEVVDVLALEPEDVGRMVGGELRVVLEARALRALDVVPQFEHAKEGEYGNCVKAVEVQVVPDRESREAFPAWDQNEDPQQRRCQMKGVPGPEKRRKPRDHFPEAEGPVPNRRGQRRRVWRPIASVVACPHFLVVHLTFPRCQWFRH